MAASTDVAYLDIKLRIPLIQTKGRCKASLVQFMDVLSLKRCEVDADVVIVVYNIFSKFC